MFVFVDVYCLVEENGKGWMRKEFVVWFDKGF
jgi:hypothetical protein